MRIAIPLSGDRCGEQFEHCDRIALVDVDIWTRSIIGRGDIYLEPELSDVLAGSLVSLGVGVIISGAMGPDIQRDFREHGVVVLVGAPMQTPEQLVVSYLLSSVSPGART